MFKSWQQQQGEVMNKNAQRRKHLNHLFKIRDRSEMYRNRYPGVCTDVQTWALVQFHLLSGSTGENVRE